MPRIAFFEAPCGFPAEKLLACKSLAGFTARTKKKGVCPSFFAALFCFVAPTEAFIARLTGMAAAFGFHLDPGKLAIAAACIVAAACYATANGLASSLGFGHFLFLHFIGWP